MDLEPSAEQDALRATVRRVLADHAPIGSSARSVADGSTWTPDRAWSELVALGTTGMLVPEAAGGLGLGLVDAAIVAEELGRVCYPGPWATTVAASLALTSVGGAGSARLARLVDGSSTGCLDALGAPLADVVLVVRGGRLLAVDGPLPAEEGIDRTQPIARVPEDATGTDLGPFDDGAALRSSDALLVLLGADALGAASAVMELAVQHAKDRHQFGQPIGAFQSVAHLCVDMLETVELARGGVLHAAWAADAGDPGAHVAALRLKASSDRLLAVAETAIQIFGGIGFTWEHAAHLWLKRLMTWTTFAGAPSTYRVELARSLAERR